MAPPALCGASKRAGQCRRRPAEHERSQEAERAWRVDSPKRLPGTDPLDCARATMSTVNDAVCSPMLQKLAQQRARLQRPFRSAKCRVEHGGDTRSSAHIRSSPSKEILTKGLCSSDAALRCRASCEALGALPSSLSDSVSELAAFLPLPLEAPLPLAFALALVFGFLGSGALTFGFTGAAKRTHQVAPACRKTAQPAAPRAGKQQATHFQKPTHGTITVQRSQGPTAEPMADVSARHVDCAHGAAKPEQAVQRAPNSLDRALQVLARPPKPNMLPSMR